MEHIGEQHFKKGVMGDDAGARRAVPGEIAEALLRALFQVHEIFFVCIPILVVVIGEVHVVDDTNDFWFVSTLANDFARVASFGKKRRVSDRSMESTVDDGRSFASPFIRARNDGVYGKGLEHIGNCGGLLLP